MKNISKILVCIFILLLVCGCGSSSPLIENEEDWNNLFDLSNYDSFSVISHIEIIGDSEEKEYDDAKAFLKDDYLYFPMADEETGEIFDYFYSRNYEENLIQEYYPHSMDESITMFQDYEFSDKEEIDEQFNEIFANFIFYEWIYLPSEYGQATYNSSDKCYDVTFSPEEYENITLDCHVYADNLKLKKVIVNISDSAEDGTNYLEEVTFSKVEDFDIPNINTTVSSEEEWKALFSNKNNFTSTHINGEESADGYMVNKDIIMHSNYSYETGEESQEFFYRHENKNKMTLVTVLPTDLSSEEQVSSFDKKVVSLDKIMNSFDDYYINILSIEDYSDYYNDLERIGNSYLLTLDGLNIVFSIEDNKIIHIIKSISENEYIEILNYNYGVTAFEDPLEN